MGHLEARAGTPTRQEPIVLSRFPEEVVRLGTGHFRSKGRHERNSKTWKSHSHASGPKVSSKMLMWMTPSATWHPMMLIHWSVEWKNNKCCNRNAFPLSSASNPVMPSSRTTATTISSSTSWYNDLNKLRKKNFYVSVLLPNLYHLQWFYINPMEDHIWGCSDAIRISQPTIPFKIAITIEDDIPDSIDSYIVIFAIPSYVQCITFVVIPRLISASRSSVTSWSSCPWSWQGTGKPQLPPQQRRWQHPQVHDCDKWKITINNKNNNIENRHQQTNYRANIANGSACDREAELSEPSSGKKDDHQQKHCSLHWQECYWP